MPNIKALGIMVTENIFKEFTMQKLISHWVGAIQPGGNNLNKLSEGQLGYATCQISKPWALGFQRKILFF